VVHHSEILAFFRSKIRSEGDGIVEVMSSILIGSTKFRGPVGNPTGPFDFQI